MSQWIAELYNNIQRSTLVTPSLNYGSLASQSQTGYPNNGTMFSPQGGGSLEPQSRTDSNNNDMTFPSVETLPHWRHEQRHDVSSSNWRQSHTPIPDQLQQQQHDVPFC
jgi:hypothetical protein